jgi:hypothetical protein
VKFNLPVVRLQLAIVDERKELMRACWLTVLKRMWNVALSMQSEYCKGKTSGPPCLLPLFHVLIFTSAISALLFVVVLSWFNVLQIVQILQSCWKFARMVLVFGTRLGSVLV